MSGDVTWLRYVRIADIAAYLALGWIDLGPMPPPHGYYSNLLEWAGEGAPKEP